MDSKLTPELRLPARARALGLARERAGHRRGWRQAAATTAVAALTVSGALVAVGLGASSANGATAPTVVSAVDFEDGTTGTWTKSGGATLAVVDNPDGAGKVLSITRAADYEGLQSPAGIYEPGTTYTFSMKARLGAGLSGTSDVRFVAKPAYTWIGNTAISADAWTTVTGEWTAPADADAAALQAYLGTANRTEGAYELLVDDILVTEPAPASTTETVLSSDFEDGTAPWTGRGATVAVDADAHAGDQALKVTGRTSGWNGAQTDVSKILTKGEYHVTGWVKLVAGQAATQLNFGMNQPGASNEYPWVGSRVDVTDSEWVQLDGYYTVLPDTPPTNLYVESASATAEFLLDDVVITHETTASEGPEPGTVIVDTGFEDETLQGWAPRQANDTAPTVAVVDGGADGTAFAAEVSDRDSDGDGLQYDVTDSGTAGATLEFEAWVRFAEGEPTGDLTLSARTVKAGVDGASDSQAFSNLASITGARNDGWTKVGGQFTMPGFDKAAELYFEAKYNSGNVSRFLVDEVRVWVPEPPVVETDLTPLKDTIDVPGVGVAVDSRETTGNASQLLLHHFNQITPENHMKVEAWYDADHNFTRHAEATALLDYAQENDLRLYGHVLVWHGQTPDWFFQHDDGTAITSSDADKQLMRERLHDHIFNVAESIAGDYGPFGSDTNPMVGIDVVNEVVSDANEPVDGLRRSKWYGILGEEFISLAFRYADEAFNHQYAADGSDRPVTLFINDYNTEQSGKQDRYFALVQRLLAAGVPVDGVGHQFHSSLTTPISSLDATLTRFSTLPVVQAVTELDVTLGTPVTEANLIKQGHWYRDAFEVFRAHAEDLFSVTLWGLDDARSWRSEQAPLLFDGGLQAKYAYYGAVGDEDGVPSLIASANVFGGDVALEQASADSVAWRNLPAQRLTNSAGTFVPRWTADHLTLLVSVASGASDAVEVSYDGETYGITASGSASGGAEGIVLDDEGEGWRAVLHVPHSGVAVGDSAQADVRVLDGADVVGAWNSAGATGTLAFLEDLSTVDVAEAAGAAPAVDGVVDDVWADANVVSTDKTVEGAADGASAKVRTLWKGDDTLYVLAEVTDPVIDVTSGDPWNQDSVEFFLDLGNAKTGSYGPNDAQMRISVDNVRSFGTGDAAVQAARLTSATKRTDTGYVVELAVALKGQSGGQNDVPFGGAETFQGVDFQVNDGRGGSRYSVHTWAEPTGTGYQTTARWGVAHLVAAAPEEPTPPLTAEQLTGANRGGVAVPGQVKAGGEATLKVDGARSAEVAVWFYGAEPTLTTGTTSRKGDITIDVPAGTAAGKYKVAVFEAEGTLLGWNEVRVR